MNRRDERVFRTKLLIHPEFQLTLIGLNWAVITLVFGIMRIQSSRILADIAPLTGYSGIRESFASHYLAYQSDRFNTTLLWAYVTAMIASGALTLIASYRFAGPLARLKSYFRQLGQPGTPTHELRFRSGDFFSDIPPVVNEAIKRLKETSGDKDVDFSKRAG
jgi:hypothetical protein